jgi:hypothetical protein
MSLQQRAILLLTAFIMLSLLLSSAHAAQQNIQTITCVITNTQVDVGTCIASAIPLAAIGILISLLLGSVAYMAGQILNYAPLKELYKREVWETIKSGLIIAIIFSSIAIASAIVVGFAGNSAVLPGQGQSASSAITSNLGALYTTAQTSYLMPQLTNTYAAFGGLLGFSLGAGILRTLSFAYWVPIPIPIPTAAGFIVIQSGARFSPLQSTYFAPPYISPDLLSQLSNPSLSSPNSFISIASITTITLMIIFQFQYDLIYVIAAVGLGVFIPIGIILRAMPFVRGIGGTMIAIGIGLAIIYPALLVGFNMPITNYMYSVTAPPTTPTPTCPLVMLFYVQAGPHFRQQLPMFKLLV